MREALFQQGKRFDEQLAAGTYARQICQRLLIDLSYNSSRLEGNTYSRLDTQKLVEEGVSAEGKVHEETVMIMNHKEAILFLVENAQDIALNSLTIRAPQSAPGARGGFAAQEDAAAMSSRSVFAANPKCRADQSATGVSK